MVCTCSNDKDGEREREREMKVSFLFCLETHILRAMIISTVRIPSPPAKLVRTLSPCEEGRNEKPNEVTEALQSLIQVLKGWAHDPKMGRFSCM